MRPDAGSWQTSKIIAPDFLPKRVLAGHYVFWVMAAVVFHTVVAVAASAALKTTGVQERWSFAELGAVAPLWLWQAAVAQVAGAVRTCIVILPMLLLSLRGRRRQIRELLAAVRHFAQSFAQGISPKPVSVSQNGELGYLATAFNDMAGRLEASRRRLVETNENLEIEVQRRTQELRTAVAKLHEMASQDPLTGLANRARLNRATDISSKPARTLRV